MSRTDTIIRSRLHFVLPLCFTSIVLLGAGFFVIRFVDWNAGLRGIPFEESAWRRADDIGENRTVRSQMIDDLLRQYDFHGWEEDAVIQLLGVPDTEAMSIGFREWNIAYRLGLERQGSFSLDDEWLLFRFDGNGRVTEYVVAVN